MIYCAYIAATQITFVFVLSLNDGGTSPFLQPVHSNSCSGFNSTSFQYLIISGGIPSLQGNLSLFHEFTVSALFSLLGVLFSSSRTRMYSIAFIEFSDKGFPGINEIECCTQRFICAALYMRVSPDIDFKVAVFFMIGFLHCRTYHAHLHCLWHVRYLQHSCFQYSLEYYLAALCARLLFNLSSESVHTFWFLLFSRS